MIISMIFVTIGSAIKSIMIFPAKIILSAMLEFPESLQRPALNSVKYPTPIIFKTIFKRFKSKPVLFTTSVKALTMSII